MAFASLRLGGDSRQILLSRNVSIGLALALMLMVMGVYFPAARFGFINFDDDLYVTANPQVQAGISVRNIEWAFTHAVASNWQPVTVVSHMLDCQLFGANAGMAHAENVFFHALNAALVFVLFLELTGAAWPSWFIALLFAIHPLRIESVAWISERKDVLSAFWGFGSLIFYVRYARKRDALSAEVISFSLKRDYGLAVIFLALGLMSKAMLVTWPCVMLLLDYWPMNRFQSRPVKFLLREKIPLFGLAALASGVTFAVQHFAGAMASVEKLSMLARFENGLVSYARYLGKLFWPEKLSVFYPHPGSWPVGKIILAALLIIAISGIALGKRRAYPFLITGWLWFLGTLVPVIGLVQVGDQAMADRYTYIPSLGILIIVVGGAVELARRWKFAVIPLSALGGVVVILCVISTRRQLGYWRDSETLFQRALAVTENNYVAHNNLGAVLEGRGQIDEAMAHYAEALRLRADDEPAHYNLGNALYKKGQFDEAIAEYQNALRLNPKDAAAIKNLGNAFLKDDRADEAVVEYQAAMRLQPGNGFICYDLAKAFLQNGRADEAIKEYRQAILLKPDYAEAHNNLGSLLQAQGRLDDAIAEYQEAIRLKPDYSLAENNLAEAMRSKNSRR